MGGNLKIPAATKKGYMEANLYDGVLPTWKGARGTVQRGGGINNTHFPGNDRGCCER